MKKQISVLLLVALAFGLGCHKAPGQVPPPTAPVVIVSWPNVAGCTPATCSFVVARAICSSAAACPANTAGNTSFSALNLSTPTSALSFTDTAPPAGFVVYTVSVLSGGITSFPSPNSNTVAVPASPLAPLAPTATTSTATASVKNADPSKALAAVSSNLDAPSGVFASVSSR